MKMIDTPQLDLSDERLRIRPLQRADLDAAERWPPTDDPLYDGPGRLLSTPEKDYYLTRCRWPTRLELAIDNTRGDLIGRMSLREISLAYRQARLGILFGSPWIGQGLGTAALRLFLPYFFGRLNFRSMVLDVSASNQRALHLYEKFGFQPIGSFWREGGATQRLGWLRRPEHQHLSPCFHIDGSVYWALYYELELQVSDLLIPNT